MAAVNVQGLVDAEDRLGDFADQGAGMIDETIVQEKAGECGQGEKGADDEADIDADGVVLGPVKVKLKRRRARPWPSGRKRRAGEGSGNASEEVLKFSAPSASSSDAVPRCSRNHSMPTSRRRRCEK